MRFYLLFFFALSCALLHLSTAGVNVVRGLEAAGHHGNSTGGPPRGVRPPPPSTTASSSG